MQAHDAYFCSMLELIPAKCFHKENGRALLEQVYEGWSKTEKRKVKGALLRKFDLEQRKTNAQRQVENATEYPKQARGNRAESDDDEAEADDSEEESGADEEDEEDDEEEQSQGAEEDDDDAESDGDNKGSKQRPTKRGLPARKNKHRRMSRRSRRRSHGQRLRSHRSRIQYRRDTLRQKFKQRIAALRAQGLNRTVMAMWLPGTAVMWGATATGLRRGDDTEGGKKLPVLGAQREAQAAKRSASNALRRKS